MTKKYSVKTLRAAGLEARWTRTSRGAPIIVARYPEADFPHQRETWWTVDAAMWEAAEKEGIIHAFVMHTLLGEFFSIPA